LAINGLHTLLYTTEPEKLRAVLRDAFGFKHVDAGHGWLIFTTPPSEMGVHPAEGENWDAGARHLISFMCDDINKTIAGLRAKGIDVDTQTRDEGYGITTMMHLPGGCEVMLYEPRHPIAAEIKKTRRPSSNRSSKSTARLRQKATAGGRGGIKSQPRPRAKKARRRR
jgi:hypothetical protein